MQVVVAFEEPRARGRDHRLEKGGGAGLRGKTDARGADMGEEAFEESNLMLGQCGEQGRNGRSTHMPSKRYVL